MAGLVTGKLHFPRAIEGPDEFLGFAYAEFDFISLFFDSWFPPLLYYLASYFCFLTILFVWRGETCDN